MIDYSIAHGYSFNDGFSSHAGVLGPQTLNQFDSRGSLNKNQDSVWNDQQAMSHQSFVSPHHKPSYHHEDEDSNNSIEELVQSRPHSGQEPDEYLGVPADSSVQEHKSSSSLYPFGLLVKKTQRNTMGGISFPTINDFKRFIKTMKSSFLTPGSDVKSFFQTAGETIKNEAATRAQNIKAEPDTGYRSNSAKEGTVQDNINENEGWSEPVNEFEQSEQDATDQTPSESPSVPDPVDSSSLSQGSLSYTRPHLTAGKHPINYRYLDNGAISEENRNILKNAPEVQYEDIQSTSNKLPEQSPSGSFLGEDFSFSGHIPAEPVNPQDHSVQDYRYYLSKTSKIPPVTSDKNTQQTTYTPHRKDLTGYDQPYVDIELEDFQKDELGGENSADVSAPLSQLLNSYGKSIYVSARKGQFNASDYLPKHRERPAPTFQPYHPPVGKELQDINRSLTVHLPMDSSVSSSSNLSLQSSIGHEDVLISSPQDSQNQAFTKKQPVRPHPVMNVKLSNSLHGYLGDQRFGMINPSILTDQDKDEEILSLPEQNTVSAIQEPEQTSENTQAPFSFSLHSTQIGISSPIKFESAGLNSLGNLAPTPASETVFSRLVGNKIMSKNFGIRNMFSGRFPFSHVHGARNVPDISFTPQRSGTSLNGGYKGAIRTGFLQTLIHPSNVWNLPTNINKEPRNMAYWTPNLLFASKAFGSAVSRDIWRNGSKNKKLSLQTSQSRSAPFGNAYIVKSRNGYVRGKVSVSKTRYDPKQLGEEKNWYT